MAAIDVIVEENDVVLVVFDTAQGPAGPPGVAANTNATYVLVQPASGLPNSAVLQVSTGLLLQSTGGILTISATGGGAGTVTSVGLTAPNDLFTPTGSPVTSSGNLGLTKVSQSSNLFYASPSGSAGVPIFRPVTANDIAGLFSTGSNISIVGGTTLTFSATGLVSQYASGTVTSVGLSLPNIFVTGTAVTSSGNLTATLASQSANLIFGSPASGGIPLFRGLLLSDLPVGNYTVGYSNILNNLASGNGTGFLTQNGSLVAWRTFQGTGNRITISNPDGTGNPTFDIGSEVYTSSSSDILNKLASGVPSAGQVLVGNSTGNYTLAQIVAGTGVQVNSGSGFINIAASGYTAGIGITISPTNVISTLASTGTVASVGLSLPNIFTVSNSPVTSTGTLTGTLNTQAASSFWGGPLSGANSTPLFRAIASSDISQALAGNLIQGTNVSITRSGNTFTISSTASGGGSFTNPMTTTGDIIYSSDNLGTPTRLPKGREETLVGISSGLPTYIDRKMEPSIWQPLRIYKALVKANPNGTGVGAYVAEGLSAGLTAASPGGALADASDSDGLFVSGQTTTSTGNVALFNTASICERQTSPRFWLTFKLPAIITGIRLWAGLTTSDLSGTTTPTTQSVAGLRYDTGAGDTTIKLVTCDGASNVTVTDTLITPLANGFYSVCFDMLDSTKVVVYLSSAGATATLAATNTTNLPSTNAVLIAYLTATVLDTTAKVGLRFGSVVCTHK